MTEQPSDVVIAYLRGGGEVLTHPRTVNSWVERGYEATVDIEVIENRPMYRRVELRFYEPASALELQRFPWARIADGVLLRDVHDRQGEKVSRREAAEARTVRRRAAMRRARENSGTRTPVDDDRLRRVLALREEARRRGIRPWDVWAAAQLDYSRGYVRQLASRASRADSH